MKAILKFVAWLVAISVVVVIAAVVLVPMFFDPNDFKPQLAAAVKDHTGRELQIEGDLEMSVFPWLGVSVGKVSLGNAAGFSDPVFARSEKMQVRVKLMPLLERKLEMDTVTVHGLQVYLERNAQGATNWADLAKAAETAGGQDTGGKQDPGTPSQTPQLAGLALGGVEVVDSKLSWKDAQAGQTVTLSKVGLRTGALTLDKPVEFSSELDLNVAQPAMSGHVELSTTVAHANDGQQITAKDLKFSADLAGQTLPGGKLAAKLGADVAVDRQADTLRLGNLSITVADMQAGGAFDVSALSSAPKAVGKLSVATFDLRKLLEAVGQGSPAIAKAEALGAVSFSSDVVVDTKADSLRLGNLAISVGDLKVAGALDVNAMSSAPKVAGTLSAPTFDLRKLLDGLGQGSPAIANAAALSAVAFSTDLALDTKADTLRLGNLAVAVGDLKADGALDVSAMTSAPKLAGKLNVPRFNLRKLLEALGQTPPVTADAAVLSAVALNADLTGTTNSISLKPLKLTLDDTNVSGSLAVSDFAASALRFDLKVDGINADRYLPPAAAGEGQAAASGGSAAGAGAAADGTGGGFDLAPLRALDVDGKLALGQLTIRNLKTQDIALVLKAKDGLIRLSPVSAKLYEGSYAGNIGLDARGQVAAVSLDETLSGLKLSPLLKDLQGKDPIEGTAKLRLKATTTGNDALAMKRGLNGEGSFEFTDGALKGINIAATIRAAKAKLTGGSGDSADAPQRTDFSALGGTFTIKNGIVENGDFAAKSPLLRITGKGSANLVTEAIDYRTTASVVATSKGQGGKNLTELAGLDVPLKIGGTFSQPTYGLDEEALIKALATAKLDGVVGAQKEKITAAVKDKVQGAVGGAVGGQVEKVLGGAGLGSLTDKLGGAVGGAVGGAAAPATEAAPAAAPAKATTEQPKPADPAAAATKALKNLFNASWQLVGLMAVPRDERISPTGG